MAPLITDTVPASKFRPPCDGVDDGHGAKDSAKDAKATVENVTVTSRTEPSTAPSIGEDPWARAAMKLKITTTGVASEQLDSL